MEISLSRRRTFLLLYFFGLYFLGSYFITFLLKIGITKNFFVHSYKLKFKNMIVPFWIQGVAFGVYYVPSDDETDYDGGQTHMVQLALGFFGLSFMWWND